jgi:hypothetical protein
MAVPFTFGSATAAIPLSQLDSNFATTITLGNTAIQLGNTVTTLNNMTLANVTISSGSTTLTNETVSGNLTLSGGTANGVAYLNSSKVVTTGTALVFDGTNLGVGTNSPVAKLDVSSTNVALASNGIQRVGATSSGADTGGQITFSNSDARRAAIAGRQESTDAIAGYLQFGTRGTSGDITERARIDSSGNLGIGTTSPSTYAKLAVRGSVTTNSVNYSGLFSDAVNSSLYIGHTSTTVNLLSDTAITFATGGSPASFTERARIDSSGRLGVGTTSPAAPVHAKGATIPIICQSTSTGAGPNYLKFTDSASTDLGYVGYGGASKELYFANYSADPIVFYAGAERARIDSSGNLLVGKTAATFSAAGSSMQPSGKGVFTVDADEVLLLNRLTNDGNLIRFYQASTEEGNISVSGTTVSYNGGHLSRWAQTTTVKDESLVKGTVLSNLNEMNVYTDADGNPVDNEQLNKVKVSDVEGDSNVAGVFVNWSYDEQHNVDEINMAMTGDMIIRIAQGTTVQRGDLLMSAGDGTAKPQGDDIVRSKTIAKVTSTHITCTYEDGSYCVPCVLMAC